MAEAISNEADMMQNGGRTLAERVFHFSFIDGYIGYIVLYYKNEY